MNSRAACNINFNLKINNADSSPVFLALLAVTACLLWSTAFVGIKIGLRYSDPFSFAGIRFMLAGLMLLPFWCRGREILRSARENLPTVMLVGFFQTFLLYGLFYLGIDLVPGAVAAIIVGSSPLTAAILAHFFMHDDAMTTPKTLSLSLGVIGVAVLGISRKPWASPTGLAEFLGIGLLLLSTVSSTFANILVAKRKNVMDVVSLNSLQLFFGGLLLFLLSLPVEGLPALHLPLEYYASLLWLSFLSAAAFSLWFFLLTRPGVRVSHLNLWKFIIPVNGALLSWLLLPDESPTLFPIIGMLCIAFSIIFFNRSAAQQRLIEKSV